MTPRQHEVWLFVDSFIREKGFSPSYAEIRQAIGVKSKSSVHRLLDKLVRDGFLAQRGRLPRSLSVPRAPVTSATTDGCCSAPSVTIFTISLTDDRYWLDRLGPLGFHRGVHGPFRSLEAAWIRADELNRANLGLPDA